jgi:LysM repeat protein
MTTAQELADALRLQASKDSTIQVNDALLGIAGFDDLVKADLQRSDGTLILSVFPSQIPQNPPASGFTITAAGVPAGGDGFLHLDGRWVSIQFAFGATLDVTLTVRTQQQADGTSVSWALSDSFQEVAFNGYDQVALANTQLTLATTAAQNGLQLASTLRPSGVLQAAETLLNLSTTFPLAGNIQHDAKGNLSFALDAHLGIPTFGIEGVLTLQKPVIELDYTTLVADDGTLQKFTNIGIAATISAGSTSSAAGAADGQVVLEVKIGMPLGNNDSPLLQLAVIPQGFTASLLSLGSLVAGQSWDDFFNGPAAVLKPYFATFGFIGYTMTFSTSASVTALTLRVGTLQAWPLWGNFSLQLDATLDVTFLHPGTVQTLLLHAGFNYDNRMQFDVDVYLPKLKITGRQSGDPITLSLADVTNKLFDGAITIPEDLLQVKVSGFWIEIDQPSKKFGIGATASASISLFGVQLLAVNDMGITVWVDDSGTKRIYTATLDGQISLGPIAAQVDAVLSNDPKIGCTFTVHLVNETVGTMLGHLVHLVDPTYNVSFDAPWDKLLDISLDALVLKVDITNKTVEIAYTQTIDLGFLTITELGLQWKKGQGGPSSTKIVISGNLMGIQFGGNSSNPPLAWDPINENPPAVPGGGDRLLDLRYVGIGQHVGFDPNWQPANVEAVITKMEQLALPAGGSNIPNLTSPGGLQFRSDSGWLVGADFTLLNTVQLAFIFNDPSLYGLLIALSGERAKSFAGLKFEILYHKVTDTIGVYHIELALPEVMRHLEFGEVSLTLPLVVVDIYTNGNFRIDFGFPKGLDFSNSFCLQIFPFIGYGGFYFALLNGDTSTRVPKISNGRFDPVIEFGIALSVGVGKTVDAGILSGGLSITVIGIVEGCIGWFHPSDNSVQKAEYFWLQGTIAIIGRLYATINFYIVQASLSVTAYASVTLVIESYQPILIAMSVGVSVEVSVKIVFFTIHLSFSATVAASFTIGSASPTPWKVIKDGSSSNAAPRLQLLSTREGVYSAQSRMFAAYQRVMRRALMERLLEAGDISLDWSVQTVFNSPQQLTLNAMPAITRAASGVAGVMLFGINDGIPARAATLKAHAEAAVADNPGMGTILEGLIRWAVLNARATLGENDNTLVSYNDVTLLSRAFADDNVLATALDYSQYLNPFLAVNYRMTIAAPAAASNGSDTGVAVFPAAPAITMTAGSNAPVDFAVFNSLDETMLEKMRAYFDLLAVDYEKFVADSGGASEQGSATAEAAAAGTPVPMVVFEQYFSMLMRAVVKAAGDTMQSYPFALADATKTFSIADIRTQLHDTGLPAIDAVSPNRAKTGILAQGAAFALTRLQHQLQQGDSFASVAAAFNAVLPSANQITATQISQENANAAGIFVLNAPVAFANLSWTSLAGESVNLIVARILTRAAGSSFLQQLPTLQTTAQALLTANPTVFPGVNLIAALRIAIDPTKFPSLVIPDNALMTAYATVPGDTFTSIAAMLVAMGGTMIVDIPTAVAWVLANNKLPVTDPSQPQPVGTHIALPSVNHPVAAGESIASLETLLLTDQPTVIAALLAVPAQTDLLAAQALVALPSLTYAVRANDTFSSIAALFNLTLDGLAASIDSSNSAIFAAGADITVSDADQMKMDQLVSTLAATQWTTVAPMASRFMLSGLRLPDPADPNFQKLTLAQMQDPQVLGAIQTLPLYAQTGQQFAIPVPPPDGYTIILAPDGGASWITNTSPLAFGLSADQLTVIQEIASATFAPATQLAALPLYRVAPTRYTLQKHISWQPAALPTGAVYSPTAAGNVSGSPSLWMFPDNMTAKLAADGAAQPPYAVAIGTQERASAGMTVENAKASAWATSVRVGIEQLPSDEASLAAGASIVTVTGVDDAGLVLLESLLTQLEHDDATLFLLYSPNPASSSSGLFSDNLSAATALVQTNLSTLSHSGQLPAGSRRARLLIDEPTGSSTYVAPITSAAAFLQLLWECSIVRSGGYYLQYVPASGGTLPPSLFTNGPSAQLTLVAVLASQNVAHAPMYSFNTCAIVGDNIDASSSNVFVEPATWLVAQPSSLTDGATYAAQTFGLNLGPADIAALNADTPQLLRPGAQVQVSNGSDSVRLTDTLATLASRNGVTPAQLAAIGTNASADIFAPLGIMQFTSGALSRTPAVQAGNAGFELTRPNPDPGNTQQLAALDGAAILDELFHMLAHRIVPNVTGDPDFLMSGEGLPAGPAQASPTENGGAAPSDQPNPQWDYHQAIAIAPFSLSSNGSASPALPAAAESPYAGVSPSANVSFSFAFADPYGNQLAAPVNSQSLTQPVRYFDELVGIARWPSAGASYTLVGYGTTDPAINLALTMRLDKYAVSSSLTADRALRNAATDRATYMRAYYQLSQPDVNFALTTTLDPSSHPLARDPFYRFVVSAWLALDALCATEAATFAAAGGETLASVAASYDVTVSALFAANSAALYSRLFGSLQLSIPQLYVTVNGDSLSSIAAAQSIDLLTLVNQNPWAPLNTAIDLAAPARQAQPSAADSLATLSTSLRASVSGIAASNPTAKLADQLRIAVAGIALTTSGDTFESLVTRFEEKQLTVTVEEIAVANQTVAGIFALPVTLTLNDVVPQAGASLGSLQQEFNFPIGTLAADNATLAGLFATGTSLYIGPGVVAPVPEAGTTLSEFAAAEKIALESLGLALWNGLDPASPIAVNASAALAAKASVVIPATIVNSGSGRFTSYAAQPDDANIAAIAAKFQGNDPGQLGALSVDMPGLFLVGTPVVDTASGTSIPTTAGSTFASLVAAFAAKGHTVTAASLAHDNATTANLVNPGGVWIVPPAVALGANGDSLQQIASRYGTDAATVAAANAGALGFLAPNVALPAFAGISHTTQANDTLNSLIGVYTPPGGTAPRIADLANAFAAVSMVRTSALILLPPPLVAEAVQVNAAFAVPITPLGVTVTESRNSDWVASDFTGVPNIASTAYDVPAMTGGSGAQSLSAFATSVETALPGVRVATGQQASENDDPWQRTVSIVNFSSPRGPAIAYSFEDQSTVRSFAIPPLSTSLASGTVNVTPYVSGKGLDGNPRAIVFAGVDLDVWGAEFLAAMDMALAPVYAVPAQAISPKNFTTIVNAKKTLADSISSCVQYIIDGGGPGEYGDADPRRDSAIDALKQSLLVALSSAYSIESVVQTATIVNAPYSDATTAPRLGGKGMLLQPSGTGAQFKNASLSTAKTPLAATTQQQPAYTSFLLTLQAPATDRNLSANIGYDVTEVEIPLGPPDVNGYQASRWLTLVHPLSGSNIPGVTLPIPLRAYPLPPTLLEQSGTNSYTPPQLPGQLTRWDASATWSHDDADQDQTSLHMEIGTAKPGALGRMLAAAETPTLFQALAQFITVWPLVASDFELLASRTPGDGFDPTSSGVVSAFATMAAAIAAAWPKNVFVPKASLKAFLADSGEILPGPYDYSLVRAFDGGPNLTTVTVTAGTGNPAVVWPNFLVNDGSGPRTLTFQFSTGNQAVYAYPAGIARGLTLQYQVDLRKLDLVIIPDFETSVSITRNADLIATAKTSELFIYQTPFTGFPSPLIPLLQFGDDFTIGSGPIEQLDAALVTFFEGLLSRTSAAQGAKIRVRVAASYGYEVTQGPQSAARTPVRGRRSAVAAAAPALVPMVPILLVPATDLIVNGDGNASIDAFAKNIGDFVTNWAKTVGLTAPNAAMFFEVSLFSSNSGSSNKPLMVARSVRYGLA